MLIRCTKKKDICIGFNVSFLEIYFLSKPLPHHMDLTEALWQQLKDNALQVNFGSLW